MSVMYVVGRAKGEKLRARQRGRGWRELEEQRVVGEQSRADP